MAITPSVETRLSLFLPGDPWERGYPPVLSKYYLTTVSPICAVKYYTNYIATLHTDLSSKTSTLQLVLVRFALVSGDVMLFAVAMISKLSAFRAFAMALLFPALTLLAERLVISKETPLIMTHWDPREMAEIFLSCTI